MLDLPGFVLASVTDWCPEDACILRVDKCRFKIQPRTVAALAPQWPKSRPSLELVLSAPLLSAIQGALQNNDQATLAQQTQTLRAQVAHQLQGGPSGEVGHLVLIGLE
ncbi:hypothetical protein [Limnohabitans sp.]|jgi:hypothetical protein|uniref:hypothetical protein n=1 Tax=Limnohabitans sp. TaxID=1907725 RepID=UPI0037BF1DBE